MSNSISRHPGIGEVHVRVLMKTIYYIVIKCLIVKNKNKNKDLER